MSSTTKISQIAALILLSIFNPLQASTIYSGVEFPHGDVSFADSVYSYLPGSDAQAPNDDPSSALGAPNYDGNSGYVSLGNGGELILQFMNNSLTASGDTSLDLWLFEIGGVVEYFGVSISTDATNWIELGTVSGQPTGIDIDAVEGVLFGELYSFVRLFDVHPNQSDEPFGEADIDAVGAIYSGAPSPVPLPPSIWLFVLGLASLFRVRHGK